MLILKKYNKVKGGEYLYSVAESKRYTLPDVALHFAEGGDIQFQNCNEAEVLLATLRTLEPQEREFKGDTSFLNRIIRGGGFASYIQSLEGKAGNGDAFSERNLSAVRQ